MILASEGQAICAGWAAYEAEEAGRIEREMHPDRIAKVLARGYVRSKDQVIAVFGRNDGREEEWIMPPDADFWCASRLLEFARRVDALPGKDRIGLSIGVVKTV